MINVGVLSNNHVVISAVRGILASSEDVNVRHFRELGAADLPGKSKVDVLVCESVSPNALTKVLAKCRAADANMCSRVLILGKPPAECALRKLIQIGVLGFVGATAVDFGAMPDAIRTVASGQFYMPSTTRVGHCFNDGCQ